MLSAHTYVKKSSPWHMTSLTGVVYFSIWLKYQKDAQLNVFKCIRVISGHAGHGRGGSRPCR